jgi:hypothetical protein
LTPDEKGQTRRERNDQFGEPSPPLIVPQSGLYLWEWYFDLSDSLRRVRNGICEPFPPTEYIAWRAATGNIVYAHEYAILRAMDGAYCAEMNVELADYRARQKAEAEANAPKPGRRR